VWQHQCVSSDQEIARRMGCVPEYVLNFVFFILKFLKEFKVLRLYSKYKKSPQSPHSSAGGLYRILSSSSLVYTLLLMKNPPKCCTIFVCIGGCLNISNIQLTSRPPIESCILSRFWGGRFVEKEGGLCTYDPTVEEVWVWRYFCVRPIRTL
jgi:hypothetical protein